MESSQDKMFKVLENSDSNSLLKKHLSRELYNKLKDRKTPYGGTLEDCIKSGCKNLDSGVGLYACDPDAYDVFTELFDAVIKDYHVLTAIKHPKPDFGDFQEENLDPSGNYIISTRVRVGRSHEGFGFPPVLTAESRVAMEKKTKAAFEKLDGNLKGKYYPLTGMSQKDKDQLTNDHFLFNDNDRFLREAGGYNDWPTGRGIYLNGEKTFLIWVNEEDHLRFISMQKGGDLKEVYNRLVKAIKLLEAHLSFAHHDKYGYLTFCPTNLGTTCRASVHIKVPKLEANGELKNICDKYNLQARGIHGEHTESVGSVYDISNKRRLGLTEFEAVMEMCTGIKEIIKAEKNA